MQKQSQELLSTQREKNVWMIVGICTLIAVIYHTAMIRITQANFLDYHPIYLTPHGKLKPHFL